MNAVEAPAKLTEPFAAVSADPYDRLSAAERYIHRTRDYALLRLLRRHGVESFAGRRILELGAGTGSLLRSLVAYGAGPGALTGIDINFRRLRRARNAAPGTSVAVADGALLPFRSEAFDLVFVFTALSSMRDIDVRRHAAHETLRVLRPGGLAIVYDFWTNPFNSHVQPVSTEELRRLFEPRPVEIERVTLAPPIARALGGREPLCRPLERLSFLRTHILAVIEKEPLHG
jgi:ubiquinone/menaquinone biosynthesis C-methylase UbiE